MVQPISYSFFVVTLLNSRKDWHLVWNRIVQLRTYCWKASNLKIKICSFFSYCFYFKSNLKSPFIEFIKTYHAELKLPFLNFVKIFHSVDLPIISSLYTPQMFRATSAIDKLLTRITYEKRKLKKTNGKPINSIEKTWICQWKISKIQRNLRFWQQFC